ncbi:MAG: LPS export ABC transporter periplasmic protein LptC [Gemmatimonadaceae bacterium]
MRIPWPVAPIVLAIAACSPKKQPPAVAHSPLADSADQVMYNARLVLTDEGVARARLESDTAYFFDDNTRVELEKVHTTFFTVTGAKNAVLTSERGTYNSRTSAMVARKNVVVVSEDGRRLTTPELRYSQQANQISSDSAFVLTEPNRRLAGVGFRSDPDMKNMQVLKGATGVLKGVSTQAPAASSTPASVPKR